jgi:hypothetical protein
MHLALLFTLFSFAAPHPAAAGQPLIVFSTTGGFAGIEQRVTIRASGATVIEENNRPTRRLKLPKPAVVQLRTLLERIPFRRLDDYYGPVAPDAFTYDLTFHGKTVRVESASPRTPHKLRAVIAQLSSTVEEARRPFRLRLTATGEHFFLFTLYRRRSAEIRRGDGETTTARLTKRCDASIRAATRHVRGMKPGFQPRGNRNPPPTLEVTRAFESFHSRLNASTPRSAKRLLRLARTRCGAT